MSDLPPELRDRAARAAMSAHTSWSKRFVYEGTDGPVSNRWNVVVDAVAEVLAGHVGCEHLDGPYRRLVVERDDLRVRAERAEAELAQARGVVEAAKAYVAAKASGYCRTEDDVRERRELFGQLARSVSPDRQELREEDLLVEHFDVPDQSVIDESGRGVRLTHTPSGVAVSSGAERTQLQNMAQCIELLRRELAARSVSPDPTTALSGPAGAAHTEEET